MRRFVRMGVMVGKGKRVRGRTHSVSQRAGHVPHPYGVCLTSKRKSPGPYWALDSRRTEKRPVEASGSEPGPTVVSTRINAVEGVAYVRFCGC